MFNENRFVLQQAYLLLTRKCNLSCSHCIRSSNSSFSEFMHFDIATSVISQIAEDNPDASILISGGEPTLHPRFFDIVEYATARLKSVMINTNGLSLKKLLALKTLNNQPKIQISIDGCKHSHDSIRGSGTYDKALNNIAMLSSHFNLTVSTTVSKNNIDTLFFLDSDLAPVQFNKWTLKRVVVYGRAGNSDDIHTNTWNALVDDVMNNFSNSYRIKISKMFSLESIVHGCSYNNHNNHNLSINCGTGRSKLYINPNGTVYPCACMEHLIFGDFRVERFNDIRDKLSHFEFIPVHSSICHKCRSWSLCHGGCPGQFINYNFLGDPRCPIIDKAYGAHI